MRTWWAVIGVLIVGCGSDAGSGGVSGPDEATFVMEPFTVDPGGEVFLCQTFANPFVGGFIRQIETHMSTGSHHLIVNYGGSEPESLAPCSGLIPPSGPYATQVADDEYTYPDGVGALLQAGSGFQLVTHYLNTTPEPLSPTVEVTLRRAPGGRALRPAMMSTWVDLNVNIPPHQTVTKTSGGGFGYDAELLWLLPHMHSRGTHFAVTMGQADPATIFETNDWEVAPHRFDPPLLVSTSDTLSYSCTWANDTDETLTFGESAAKNEMCLVALQYVYK